MKKRAAPAPPAPPPPPLRGRCTDCGHVRQLASIKPGQDAVAEIVQLEAARPDAKMRPKRVLYARTRAAPNVGWCGPCFALRYGPAAESRDHYKQAVG